MYMHLHPWFWQIFFHSNAKWLHYEIDIFPSNLVHLSLDTFHDLIWHDTEMTSSLSFMGWLLLSSIANKFHQTHRLVPGAGLISQWTAYLHVIFAFTSLPSLASFFHSQSLLSHTTPITFHHLDHFSVIHSFIISPVTPMPFIIATTCELFDLA